MIIDKRRDRNMKKKIGQWLVLIGGIVCLTGLVTLLGQPDDINIVFPKGYFILISGLVSIIVGCLCQRIK